MGADYYEDEAAEISENDSRLLPPIGIGRNSVIDRAIIDKNARIGESVVITPDGKAPNVDSTNYYIRDGVVVIPKNAVIPTEPGSEICCDRLIYVLSPR